MPDGYKILELTRFSGRCRACDYRPVLNGLLFSN
jgi:hypothetical protein